MDSFFFFALKQQHFEVHKNSSHRFIGHCTMTKNIDKNISFGALREESTGSLLLFKLNLSAKMSILELE